MKKTSDYHVHTCHCDGNDTPAVMAATAHGLGFRVLGFSGHSSMPTAPETWMDPTAAAAYRSQVRDLAAQYEGRMQVLCGLELDYHSDEDGREYDYIIGSVHNVTAGGALHILDHTAEGFRQLLTEGFGGDYGALAEQYFAQVADVVRKTRCHIIGHFDLITKFRNLMPLQPDQRYWDAAFEAVRTLAPTGVPFEINVGAITRGYRTSPYPDDRLLREIRAHGGSIILTGDCHDHRRLGDCYDVAATAAQRCGFTERMEWDGSGFSPVPLL